MELLKRIISTKYFERRFMKSPRQPPRCELGLKTGTELGLYVTGFDSPFTGYFKSSICSGKCSLCGRAAGVVAVVVIMLTGGHFLALGGEWKFRAGGSYYGDDIADGDKFDYIVVGSGAAGSAVAARLALAGQHVLLVEAGDDPHLSTKIPGLTFTLTGSSMDWYYDTLPNNISCLGSKGHRCRFNRGRCLGGSTSINYMMYSRGNRRDYDFNMTGWTWEDLKPYFLRYEGLKDLHRLPKSSREYHNTSGLVPIGFFGDSGNPWSDRAIEGLTSLNFPYNPDVNGKSQIGVTKVLGFTAGGERVITTKAYLEQKNVKRNLKVVKNTRCTKIIIDENNIARGVVLTRGANEMIQLFVQHEVVLSAGSIGTPQLLMLSGIGPKKHLMEFGIPLKADLPVGEGMSDHVMSLINIKVDHNNRSLSIPLALGSKGLETLQWLTTRSGPMTSIGLTDITAFANTLCYNYTLRRLVNDRPECEVPSMQFIYVYINKGIASSARKFYKYVIPHTDDIWDQISTFNEESAYVVISPVVLQPKSRGWIRLASSDPLVPPAITPNYFADDQDVEEIIRSIRIIEQMVETPIYKKYNASILHLHLPGCPAADKDGYWECYARHMTFSVQHAVGTAPLGPVLDERLRVKGVRNLRVGDASVLPRLPRGNTAAAVIAIGERLSDFLIQDKT